MYLQQKKSGQFECVGLALNGQLILIRFCFLLIFLEKEYSSIAHKHLKIFPFSSYCNIIIIYLLTSNSMQICLFVFFFIQFGNRSDNDPFRQSCSFLTTIKIWYVHSPVFKNGTDVAQREVIVLSFILLGSISELHRIRYFPC